MTAIWLLSSRGRPAQAQETIDACQKAGMTSPGVLYVDETVEEYRGIRLPRNWSIHYEREWGSLQASMSWCFNEYPAATHYGWLADDVRPQTVGFDKQLEAAAGKWWLSYARDLWLSETPQRRAELEEGTNLSSGLCWGGDLVRTVGWWATPGLRQAYIDVIWCRIVEPLNLHRYVHDVIVEHLNYRTGKRERDAVDDWERGGVGYIARDIEEGERWLRSPEYVETLTHVAGVAERLPPRPEQIARAVQRLRDDYANAHWSPGMSAARLVRVLEKFDRSGKGADLAEVLAVDADDGSA